MLDQSQFALLSGSSALACLSISEFETVCKIMEAQLFLSLCLTEAPKIETDDGPITDPLWDQLLADALAVSVLVKQDQGIASENMRNYSYQLRDYAYTWEMLGKKSQLLINHFNACSTGITFQRDEAKHIYGYDHRECI